MKIYFFATLMFALFCAENMACRRSVVGKNCENDEQCGAGFDCYNNACVQVCTSDADCVKDSHCLNYRCSLIAQAPKGATSLVAGSPALPAPPGGTETELRAIRYELEKIRQNQAEILRLLKDPEPPIPPRRR